MAAQASCARLSRLKAAPKGDPGAKLPAPPYRTTGFTGAYLLPPKTESPWYTAVTGVVPTLSVEMMKTAGAATQWSRSEYGFARHKRDCFSIRWRAAAGMDFRGERHGLPVGRWIW